MPQLNNLVLKDRTSPTPVDHTFTPRSIADGVATLVETSGVPIGNNTFSVSLRQTPGDGRFKSTVKLTCPVVQTQTVNGVSTPVVVRTGRVTATFDFDPSSSTQERADLIGLFQDSLASSKWTNDVLVGLQGVY